MTRLEDTAGPAARLVGLPLMVAPHRLGRMLVQMKAASPSGAVAQLAGGKVYPVMAGVAVIRVSGVLVDKLGCVSGWGGYTGYDGLRVQVLGALADPEVRGVVLDIDSAGGMVAGLFDLVDDIERAKRAAGKPVWAILSEEAYSAAYAIAAVADQITIPRTGGAGSIGTMMMHVDLSAALTEAGIAVTLIHTGAHKVDCNPYEPLPAEVRDAIRAELEGVHQLFCATVGRLRRGAGLTAAAAARTEARCLTGADAVAAKLADVVASPAQAMAAFLTELGRR